MSRLFAALSLAVVFSLAGCPTEGPDEECGTFIWEFTCENGDCSCDDDLAFCVDPDETTEDDSESCDNVCIECAE